jgi:hypothetical protein
MTSTLVMTRETWKVCNSRTLQVIAGWQPPGLIRAEPRAYC